MIHRFYTGTTKDRGGEIALTHDMWVNDKGLVNQVLRVLRMRSGEEVVLFNGEDKEVLYRITEIEPLALRLQKVTDLTPKNPERNVILAWSLLKKDKNDWVLQKCTELGVSHFLPMITDRTEKTGFDVDRAHKIVVESIEQSGRHMIPLINEPQGIKDVIGQYHERTPICVADMAGELYDDDGSHEVVVLVGPEGGWSDKEREYFAEKNIPHISISDFILRAETACLSAVNLLVS